MDILKMSKKKKRSHFFFRVLLTFERKIMQI
uniref:Uncharacterized protein n=1 Tax=viral metagenome TaxID=1070528 RepID=A0A6C0JJB6_9ZZZZ